MTPCSSWSHWCRALVGTIDAAAAVDAPPVGAGRAEVLAVARAAAGFAPVDAYVAGVDDADAVLGARDVDALDRVVLRARCGCQA